MTARITRRYLRVYLNDHLCGSIAGCSLARRAVANATVPEIRASLEVLVPEIESDRQALRNLMRRFGVPADPVKVGAGYVLERVGRFKLNGHLVKRSPLSSVVELEILSLGVEGKLALWRNLRSVSSVTELSEALAELIDRAEAQRAELERLRLLAFKQLFGTVVSTGHEELTHSNGALAVGA